MTGNLAIGFSASSATIHPQIRYAGRLFTDPLNQLAQGEAHSRRRRHQTETDNRWGDYSDLTVDPVDDCTFWYTNEYYATPNAVHLEDADRELQVPVVYEQPDRRDRQRRGGDCERRVRGAERCDRSRRDRHGQFFGAERRRRCHQQPGGHAAEHWWRHRRQRGAELRCNGTRCDGRAAVHVHRVRDMWRQPHRDAAPAGWRDQHGRSVLFVQARRLHEQPVRRSVRWCDSASMCQPGGRRARAALRIPGSPPP